MARSKGVTKLLGKRPHLGDKRTLMFANFVTTTSSPPPAYDPWKRRAPFLAHSYGNTQYGCCTKASQAVAATRFERLEGKSTILITEEEVLRVYREGCQRHYGTTDDVGMYELDALNDFRNAATTFKDSRGHPITIDAFTRIHQSDVEEVKAAIALSGKFGIKLCFNLPLAWEDVPLDKPWDVPSNGRYTGEWEPGSWGGHSMFAQSYDRVGPLLDHTWYDGKVAYQQRVTWAAVAAYCDEAYWLVDSMDDWRKKKSVGVDLSEITKAVNKVSPCKIK